MSDWMYHYDLGLDLKQQGALQQSADHHLKALELAPDLPFAEAWHNAGAALLRLGEAGRAQPYLEEALRRYAAAQTTGPESPAYYLFWQACAHGLLAQKQEMLDALRRCLADDDAYAREADTEEDLRAYVQDADFRTLIDPVLEKIARLTYRGESLSQDELNPEQRACRAIFAEVLTALGWVPDAFVEDLFAGGMSVSPQAMHTYSQNPGFYLRASLHLDTHLLFVELQNRAEPDDIMQFRLYFVPARLPAQLRQCLQVLGTRQATLCTDSESLAPLLRAWAPLCDSLQLQEPDGTRHTVHT